MNFPSRMKTMEFKEERKKSEGKGTKMEKAEN
jgi:hypothetical protein